MAREFKTDETDYPRRNKYLLKTTAITAGGSNTVSMSVR
jgi:hypothetical protein